MPAVVSALLLGRIWRPPRLRTEMRRMSAARAAQRHARERPGTAQEHTAAGADTQRDDASASGTREAGGVAPHVCEERVPDAQDRAHGHRRHEAAEQPLGRVDLPSMLAGRTLPRPPAGRRLGRPQAERRDWSRESEGEGIGVSPKREAEGSCIRAPRWRERRARALGGRAADLGQQPKPHMQGAHERGTHARLREVQEARTSGSTPASSRCAPSLGSRAASSCESRRWSVRRPSIAGVK